jgi:hypothetical protein
MMTRKYFQNFKSPRGATVRQGIFEACLGTICPAYVSDVPARSKGCFVVVGHCALAGKAYLSVSPASLRVPGCFWVLEGPGERLEWAERSVGMRRRCPGGQVPRLGGVPARAPQGVRVPPKRAVCPMRVWRLGLAWDTLAYCSPAKRCVSQGMLIARNAMGRAPTHARVLKTARKGLLRPFQQKMTIFAPCGAPKITKIFESVNTKLNGLLKYSQIFQVAFGASATKRSRSGLFLAIKPVPWAR